VPPCGVTVRVSTFKGCLLLPVVLSRGRPGQIRRSRSGRQEAKGYVGRQRVNKVDVEIQVGKVSGAVGHAEG